MKPSSNVLLVSLAVATLAASWAAAADDFERPPIEYSATAPNNPIERLQRRLDTGAATLEFDSRWGYLRSVLDALRVPLSSQALVFSRTSLQQHRIRPDNPRALYFNDDVYVGYVRSGDVLEVSVADPRVGTAFYLLDQTATERPRFERRTDDCLACHGGPHTRGVPGHVIRSIYPDASGQPLFAAGSHRVEPATPFRNRWGGWYVSGRLGEVPHRGNATYRPQPGTRGDDPATLEATPLGDRFEGAGYPAPHSDLVALTVLAHQTHAHNALAKASFDTRIALFREAELNRELGEPAGRRWPSTDVVLDGAAATLVECFLLCDEPTLEAPIEGATAFAAEFAAAGPRDPRGRSLRELDLTTRLFRHPCSFLVYSESFDALPEELRWRFWNRMDAVLGEADASGRFGHLAPDDRAAIREILAATKPGAPASWRSP